MTIALYSIDPVTGEADGTVYHFCSKQCRDQFPVPMNETVVDGQSDDYVYGSHCDECNKVLEDPPVAGWRGIAVDTEGRMPQ